MPAPTSALSTHVTTATLWRLAWPIILSNISVPLLGLMATGIIGHLPDARYLGAVTVGVSLFDFLFWGFGFLRMGTTGMTSQAMGRKDDAGMRLLLAQSVLIAASIGGLLIVLSPWLIPLGLKLLGGSSEVVTLAHRYALIRIWAAPAALVNYALLGWLLGRQQARSAMWITIINNLITIGSIVLLVQVVDLRSDGAAWAPLIADYATLGISAMVIRRQLHRMTGHLPWAPLYQWRAYLALFSVNGNLFIRTLCLLFAMSFFTAQGNRLGDTTLSANGVLMEFIMLVSFAMEGFAQAAETLTGEAFGARHWARFAAVVRTCSRIALVTALIASSCFWWGGHQLIALLTNLAEVRTEASHYLPWITLMPLIAVWSYLFDGVFVGATDSRAMRNALFGSLAVFLGCWWATRGLGNHGLWASFTLFMIIRAASLVALYAQRRRRQWADDAI